MHLALGLVHLDSSGKGKPPGLKGKRESAKILALTLVLTWSGPRRVILAAPKPYKNTNNSNKESRKESCKDFAKHADFCKSSCGNSGCFLKSLWDLLQKYFSVLQSLVVHRFFFLISFCDPGIFSKNMKNSKQYHNLVTIPTIAVLVFLSFPSLF